MTPNVRSRWGKFAELITHGFRSITTKRRLEALKSDSPVARAIIAVVRDDFAPHERAGFAEIENLRKRLYSRRDEFEWSIEGAIDPAALPPPALQVVGERARISSVKAHWGRFLYAVAREVKPAICIELGSCFGMSGAYIQAGLRQSGAGHLITFEGCRAMAEIASENYRSLGLERYASIVGDFDRELAPALDTLAHVGLAFVDGNHRLDPTVRYDALIRRHSRPGGVIVHDDIRWSSEMEDAWRRVRSLPGARLSFDSFRFGMIELGTPEQVPVQLSAWFGLSHLR